MANKGTPEDVKAEAAKHGSSLFKLGDKVRILRSRGLRGRIVELRGKLGPGGAEIYRVRIYGMAKPTYAEVREDQLELIPADT
jgi:uroporphyrinogen-III synthase